MLVLVLPIACSSALLSSSLCSARGMLLGPGPSTIHGVQCMRQIKTCCQQCLSCVLTGKSSFDYYRYYYTV